MRIVIVGQRRFGKAALEAFQSRGHEIVGVFVAPDKKGAEPDTLKLFALDKGIPLYQFDDLRSPEALSAIADLKSDMAVMAYVLQFVPEEFAKIPIYGTIQFHPSLLPKYRGPSAINWAIVCGEEETGITVFRPTDGMDEGPILLQKRVPIHQDETLGALYHQRLFPLGIEALLETADRIALGDYEEKEQDNAAASYEGWFRTIDARINWNNHVNQVYNLIRGCNPKPGAWSTVNGLKFIVLDARKHLHAAAASVRGRPGSIVEVDDESFFVEGQGGEIRIFQIQLESGEKMQASDFARQNGLIVGSPLGN